MRLEAHRGDSGFAEANAGLQPEAVLKPDRDNDTSIIRGPAIRSEETLGNLMYKGVVPKMVQHLAGHEKATIS